MLYAIHCLDKAGHGDVRLANREAHLAYVGQFADQLFMAGPLLNENGDMCGSLLVMEFPDSDAVQTFCDHDPYKMAGLFERVAINPWKKLLPA
jgi:uncharacterized protein YciI